MLLWKKKKIYFTLVLIVIINHCNSFLMTTLRNAIDLKNICLVRFMTFDDDPPISESSSLPSSRPIQDLTDRFKYKVNALMGTYDPVHTTSDNERNNGNILNAMIIFPTDYCFNVVGKTNGDERLRQRYIDDVKRTVQRVSGECLHHHVTERGSRYTKISITVKVDSTAVINSIYEALGTIDRTVMKF